MKLGVSERLVLLNLLPAEGNIITLRVVQQLRMDLAFSEEELAAAEIVQKGDQFTWNATAAGSVTKDVPVGDATRGMVVEALKALDNERKLTALHIPLYEQFVEQPKG